MRTSLWWQMHRHRLLVLFILFLVLRTANGTENIVTEQNTYPRVRDAYEQRLQVVQERFQSSSVIYPPTAIFIRILKSEEELELWAANRADSAYTLIHTYPIRWMWMPGDLGPKRQQGDHQVPEGFYQIDRLNPDSRFHLSLGINYPNSCDRQLTDAADPGGDIFIHGSVVSTGCIPVGDSAIEELYITVVDAMANGQETIPVHIFPCRMDNPDCSLKLEQHGEKVEEIWVFWSDIHEGYRAFEKNRIPPLIECDESGRYSIVDR